MANEARQQAPTPRDWDSEVVGQDTLDLRILLRAVEQSPSIVMIADLGSRIVYVNPKFSEVTGYKAGEVLGRNPRFLSSGAQSSEFYAEMWATVRADREWRGEFCNRKKDGGTYWESASMSAVKNAEGRITHYVKVSEDITRRKDAEEALRVYMAELEAHNAELDAYAHTVAHDLKNPLALLVGYADYLLDSDAELPAEQLQIFKAIKRNSFRMGNIIDELLLLAQVRRLDVPLQPVDMAAIVAESVARLEQMIQERQAEVLVAENWPAALGYGPWIEEVWVNYVSNALKYGGSPPRVELGATPEGDWVRFWVRDNGQGLTPEEQARLFVPFTQLSQARAQGHGLGLSIVRRIVEKLGGEVAVTSGPGGRGSVFGFTLKAVPCAANRSQGQL